MAARIYEQGLYGLWLKYARIRPYLTTGEAALAKKQGEPFWDCARSEADYAQFCPGMVVVPAGSFMMGSPDTETDRSEDEGPQREVTIKARFAVSMHEVTFDQWDACVAAGGCMTVAADSGWQRGRRPVINVNLPDAMAPAPPNVTSRSAPCWSATIGYELIQFHFHAPSEHLVAGKRFPMEVHFVHQKANSGDLGVVGVFLTEGAANQSFKQSRMRSRTRPIPKRKRRPTRTRITFCRNPWTTGNTKVR
jgi:hypothetical protein